MAISVISVIISAMSIISVIFAIPEIFAIPALGNVGDGVIKVTLVIKVRRFCKQILSMHLIRLCCDAIFKY